VEESEAKQAAKEAAVQAASEQAAGTSTEVPVVPVTPVVAAPAIVSEGTEKHSSVSPEIPCSAWLCTMDTYGPAIRAKLAVTSRNPD